jgi:hypothetical protein
VIDIPVGSPTINVVKSEGVGVIVRVVADALFSVEREIPVS